MIFLPLLILFALILFKRNYAVVFFFVYGAYLVGSWIYVDFIFVPHMDRFVESEHLELKTDVAGNSYAEDDKYYYALYPVSYMRIDKEEASRCKTFVITNPTTWCGRYLSYVMCYPTDSGCLDRSLVQLKK